MSAIENLDVFLDGVNWQEGNSFSFVVTLDRYCKQDLDQRHEVVFWLGVSSTHTRILRGLLFQLFLRRDTHLCFGSSSFRCGSCIMLCFIFFAHSVLFVAM